VKLGGFVSVRIEAETLKRILLYVLFLAPIFIWVNSRKETRRDRPEAETFKRIYSITFLDTRKVTKEYAL
jgi:hypothetical protein